MSENDPDNYLDILLYQRDKYVVDKDENTDYRLDRLGPDDEVFPYYAFCIQTAIGLLYSKRGKQGLIKLALQTNKRLQK